jgi:zinc and cadmium transporter
MDPIVLWIIAFTVLGGVLSVLAASGILLLPVDARTRMLSPLVSFAIGTLLGAAFLGLLPSAIEQFGVNRIETLTVTVLLGLLGFFLLEKMVIWRHCHTHDCEAHGSANAASAGRAGAAEAHGSASAPGDTTAGTQEVEQRREQLPRMSGGAEAHGSANAGHDHRSTAFNNPSASTVEEAQQAAAGKLILIGDGIHNLVDGVLIAAAFLTDIHLGIVTGLAVIAHEIPQEVGDFAVLLNSGYSRAQAFLYNVLTSLTTVIGGVAAYLSLAHAQSILPYVLAVAAASFIYIAVADLIPGLHKRIGFRATAQQIGLIGLGVGAISITHEFL